MKRMVCLALALGIGVGVSGTFTFGDEKKGGPPDEKALVEAMMKAATPGEAHKHLDVLAGSWDVTVSMWMDPSKPPSVSKATSESKWVLGGRYVEDLVTGDFGGMRFEGRGLTGYDNLRKKYVSSWVDNMGTGISAGVGTYDPDKKTFTFHREEIDPLSGQKVKSRDVMQIHGRDKYESTAYKIADGKEVKAMHILAVRKK